VIFSQILSVFLTLSPLFSKRENKKAEKKRIGRNIKRIQKKRITKRKILKRKKGDKRKQKEINYIVSLL